jgi:hypothetical protein
MTPANDCIAVDSDLFRISWRRKQIQDLNP